MMIRTKIGFLMFVRTETFALAKKNSQRRVPKCLTASLEFLFPLNKSVLAPLGALKAN